MQGEDAVLAIICQKPDGSIHMLVDTGHATLDLALILVTGHKLKRNPTGTGWAKFADMLSPEDAKLKLEVIRYYGHKFAGTHVATTDVYNNLIRHSPEPKDITMRCAPVKNALCG